MNCCFDRERKLFIINTPGMTYAFCITPAGRLHHLHWGGPAREPSDYDGDLSGLSELGKYAEMPYPLRQEYAVSEAFDYGQDALFPVFPDGERGARLVYEKHEIENDALHVFLRDEHYASLQVELLYRAWDGLDLIARSAVIRNLGEEPITLERAFSASLYLPGRDYRLTHFAGNWGAEYTKKQLKVDQQQIVLENHRGTRASFQHVPFVALDAGGTATETDGDVFYVALMWSGDMRMSVERSFFGEVRVTAGVNDYDLNWRLTPDNPFEAPAVVLGYTHKGFAGMSRTLYDWQFDVLIPRGKAYAERPVIYNSWYPYTFHVNEENCIGMAGKAASVGAELFVIDDGWMPGRVNSLAGLGDWTPDPDRFPRGLKPIADRCHEAGMLFGLWVEPEMVNPDSDLFRAHPDWVIHSETRPMTQKRNQLVLDLSRDVIADWCIDWLCRLIEECGLDYLKWDMNRELTERGPSRELSVKYIRNIYRIWGELNRRYPDVIFENCASGGGRADFGMAPYADRINRSDNSDTVDVMRIHEGFTTLFLPKLAGGAGNLTTCPNGINDRAMPLSFRADSALNGSMSIGVNLLTCSEEEMQGIREKVAEFKAHRADVQDSYVLRLKSVYEGNVSALEYLSRDGRHVNLFVMGHGLRYEEGRMILCLRELDSHARYQMEGGQVYTGNALMHRGVPVLLKGDYASQVLRFTRVE